MLKELHKKFKKQLKNDYINAAKQGFIPKVKTRKPFKTIPNRTHIEKALKILKRMEEENLHIVIYNGENKKAYKQTLKESLKEDFIEDDLFTYQLYKEDVSIIKNKNKHLKTLYEITYDEEMVFIFDLETVEFITHGVVIERESPFSEENQMSLSRMFEMPYLDFGLALVFYKLSEEDCKFSLNHLDSYFITSIEAQPVLVGYKQFRRPIDYTKKAEILTWIYKNIHKETFLNYSFSFAYYNFYKQ